ncbi:DUF2306 domain-containing protein [Brevibacterium sp.]|uniref:DUF2306 domain-containing protein n=1 Tax=Brevibacterium sp. TaxID=1701 RepID=UPI00281156B2|nr:DUF2306 domain-containing protein [Brevibacterium sp.]
MSALIVAIHAIAASGVVLLAPIQIARRRKDRRHRIIGRSWVVLMYLVCVSGMFIYSLTGGFTIFHALAIFTFGTTTIGVMAIRRGDVRRHIGMMVGSWVGAVFAGAFAALVPGRDIPMLAVNDPATLWTIVGGTIIAISGWVVWVLRFLPAEGEPSPARQQGEPTPVNPRTRDASRGNS